jgi:MFS family permease
VRDPVFWVLLIGVLGPGFVGTTVFYHQNYMTTFNDWPPQLFAQSLVILALTTIGCALVTGAIIDRVGASKVLPYFLLPLSAACFAISVGGPAYSLFIVMVLLGISYGISSTLFGALWPEIYGVVYLGSIRSVTVSAVVLATAAGPGLTGTLIDMGLTLPTQMKFIGVYCLLAAGVMAVASSFLRRRSMQETNELF